MGDRLKRTVFISGLPTTITEESLYNYLIPFGAISTLQIPREKKTNTARGFAFAEFEAEEDAEDVVDNLNNNEFERMTLRVLFANAPRAKVDEGDLLEPAWAEGFSYKGEGQQMTEADTVLLEESLTAHGSEAQEAIRKGELRLYARAESSSE